MPVRAFDISLTALLASCCVGVLSFGQSANADVRAGGLGTRVNGRVGGSCSAGQCKISGGKNAGINRFHRLSDFDTRGAIKGVLFDTGHKRNLVVGVTSANGSFIDKTVSLSSPAHLFLLSPGGISLGASAGFINTPQLTLSTSNRLHFAGGFFDVHASSNKQLRHLETSPLSGAFGLIKIFLSMRLVVLFRCRTAKFMLGNLKGVVEFLQLQVSLFWWMEILA